MIFDSWIGLLRVALVGPIAYVALIILLRISGKRTLAKLNAFDLIVTVALGSTLATLLTSKTVPLVEGLAALLALVALQYVVAWASVRSKSFSGLVKAEPTLLLHRGRFLEDAMQRQRVTRDEVLAGLRAAGASDPSSVEAVVLETDGSMSVLANPSGSGGRGTLEDVGKGGGNG